MFEVGDLIHVQMSKEDAFYKKNSTGRFQGKVTRIISDGTIDINGKYFLQLCTNKKNNAVFSLVRKWNHGK